MRHVDMIVNHYSATYENQDIGLAEIKKMHQARGWSREGYHEIIRLDGTNEHGRPWGMTGAGVKGKNARTLHICCVGGLRRGVKHGLDTRTPAQIEQNIAVIRRMLEKYPHPKILGHNELAATQCPGYVVSKWWAGEKHEEPLKGPVVTRGLLKVGSSGREVWELKMALRRIGYHQQPITSNYFGNYTRDQVMLFQERVREEGAEEMIVDGMVGPVTWVYIIQKGGL